MANCILNMYGKCHSLQNVCDVFDQIAERNEVSWTSMIAVYAKHGLSRDAFDVFGRMQDAPLICPNEVTFISVLIACNHSSFFTECNLIFTMILIQEKNYDLSVSNALVTAYAKCGSVRDAHEVFTRMPVKTVVSWTMMIKAFSGHDDGNSVGVFRQMLIEGVQANSVTYKTLLYICSDFRSFQELKMLHVVILEFAGGLDGSLGGALVTAYGQCGTDNDTMRVFHLLPDRDLSIWNCMILAFTRNGFRIQAFQHFEKMQLVGVEPDSASVIIVLSQCATLADLIDGRMVHNCGAQLGMDSNEAVECALVEMYGKCGSLTDAQAHFHRLERRNEQLWSFFIALHTKGGHVPEALALFCQMQTEGIFPNHVVFSSLLSALEGPHVMIYGRIVHLQIRETLSEICDVVGSSLVSMYGRFGDLEASQAVFESMGAQKSVVLWNALCMAYNQHGQQEKGLRFFKLMVLEDVIPSGISFGCILGACADICLCKQGEHIYSYAVECELETDVMVNGAMINVYGKYGRLEDAHCTFRRMSVQGLLAWNSIILAHALHGNFNDVLFFYEQMKLQDVKPSDVTFTVMLEGCSNFEEGKVIHHLIIQSQLESVPLLCNALISMYGDCGTLQSALNVFNRSPEKNLITWNIMMGLHARYLHFAEVFRLFCKMQCEDFKLNEVSLTHALSACTSLAAVEEGRLIYGYAIDLGVHTESRMQSALVNLLGNCGHVKDAQNVFYGMQEHDVVSSTSMIVAFLQNGQIEGAISILQFMQEQGIDLSVISFVSILSACSHGGLIEVGCKFFVSMINYFDLTPTLIHLSCLLDMFSRSGQLDRAEDLVDKIPMQPVGAMWITLISACRADCDLERGKQLASHVFQLRQSCDAVLSLLSNMYALDWFSYDSATFLNGSNVDVSIEQKEVENGFMMLG